MIPTLPRLARVELRPDDIAEGDALALTDKRTGAAALAPVVAVLPSFAPLFRQVVAETPDGPETFELPRAPHPAARYVDAYRTVRGA